MIYTMFDQITEETVAELNQEKEEVFSDEVSPDASSSSDETHKYLFAHLNLLN